MSWRVVVRPEAINDVSEAAVWYDSQQPGLGDDFRDELMQVLDGLAKNPLLNARRHKSKNIRWRYPDRFPYRVIYEVVELEKLVVVAAVLHAARDHAHWRRRV